MPLMPTHNLFCWWRAMAAGLGTILAWSGCASAPTTGAARLPATALSPVAELVAPRDAWRLAEAYAREHPGSDVLVGRGDSMLPLYRDGTVLVVQPIATSELRRSMTAVFIGDHGLPVAHLLTEKTARGWQAIGLGNHDRDLTIVSYDNLIGVVVKAYAPLTRTAQLAVSADSLIAAGTLVNSTASTMRGLTTVLGGAPAPVAQ